MNVQLIQARFVQSAAAAGFAPGLVTWDILSPEDITWALNVASTEWEAADELISLFTHRDNF